ncbi:M61 family metallopeptidase [Duganella sp. HH105]|uniref:M61 family metallopeptidase n=1 Tax=Duganella sp. HH105 TaxID=1781067 RepID=UPI000877C99B|nr:M61 family metallopeptidase [Duganella sp. HH105]OEZ63145.1 M61 glycyl aminopeptidase [Duganella sp. HH105]
MKSILPLALAAVLLPAAATPITLSVDLRDAARKLYHATEIIPVRPGQLTLAYPKWLPSEHAPGPIANQAGLFISSHGGAEQTIRWTRDALDPYLYHLTVPRGVSALRVRADFITADSGSSRGGAASAALAALNWNTMLLYPYAGPRTRVDRILVTPGVTLPDGWRYATALQADGAGFKTVTLEQLVDSPLIAGRHFREIEVAPRHYLDMVADSPEQLEVGDAQLSQLNALVEQSGRLFRSRHYGDFRFLMTLSDQVSGAAVDHHQSLDNRRPGRFMVDPAMRIAYGSFLPHDFVHSWNGKYRRPAGLATPNFQAPVDTSGLWVYEGLTDYLGGVLTARAGIWNGEQYLGALAETAARYSHRPGRAWRDLQDTASMAMTLWQDGGGAYGGLRRDGFDFYGEGALVWLEVDVTLRRLSGGRKSLDDFVALFHGAGGDTPPKVLPYRFSDLVAALNAVQPHDWAGLLNARLHALGPDAPLGGVTGGGYRLVYRDTPNALALHSGASGLLYSLAMEVGAGGVVADVLEDGPARKAGLAPGMKIDTVNGRPYSTALLRQAIRDAAHGGEAIALAVAGQPDVLRLDYRGGERFPALERMPDTPDLLGQLIQPRAQ